VIMKRRKQIKDKIAKQRGKQRATAKRTRRKRQIRKEETVKSMWQTPGFLKR